MESTNRLLNRAKGCLTGQLAGDSLGSLVEFKSAAEIEEMYPGGGPTEMADGGTWNTVAGQATDDSEMALALARSIVENNGFDKDKAMTAYRRWWPRRAIDTGRTIRGVLRDGRMNYKSQANGALMRASPLAIYGAGLKDDAETARAAREDAALTHPNRTCLAANELFVVAAARAIFDPPTVGGEPDNAALYELVAERAEAINAPEGLRAVIKLAKTEAPKDYSKNQGWVLIAMQNALWQVARGAGPKEAVIDTVRRGGDADTNAAICGALLGGLYGETAFPSSWLNVLRSCKPGSPDNPAPKPALEIYWPAHATDLPEQLLRAGAARAAGGANA